MNAQPRVAIIGAGISGLAAAWALRDRARVTLFEAGQTFGGHANTLQVSLPVTPIGQTLVSHGVDTGFLVYNERTYPGLISLFSELGVESAPSEMSFSVQAPAAQGRTLEWSGTNLSSVFAQRRNLGSPRFLGMLADLLRFNRITTRIATEGTESEHAQPLGDFLQQHRFGEAFRDWYFLPMMACIWSCPTRQMLEFPVSTMIRFCHNHGLLQISDRPQWRTVRGGSQRYVERIVAQIPDTRLASPVQRLTRVPSGVMVSTVLGSERFDQVIVATHADRSLAMLGDASDDERRLLGCFRFQPNRAVLHTDTRVLPSARSAWAAWNYERAAAPGDDAGSEPSVCLHYLINKLQPLPWHRSVIVSLNPVRPIERSQVMAELDYDHPVFDLRAIRAQAELARLQGERSTWFAGAWTGYGFHEDGLQSGLAAARGVIGQIERDARSERRVA